MKNFKVRTTKLKEMKQKGEKITVLTAYDYPTAKIIDESGIDVILVGDSLGNVILGYENTIKVTLEDMIHHTKAVASGVSHSLVITDMPFMTYKIDEKEALRNAGRILQEGGAEAVKVEGGNESTHIFKRIVDAGIPVMGHIGLIPQSIHQLGGYKVQGKLENEAKKLINDAKSLEDAGCFAIVIECVPAEVAKMVTESVSIPIIGIGSGKFCDGQVLVINDLLGLTLDKPPKLAKQYINGAELFKNAIKSFQNEVRNEVFPSEENTYC